MGHRLTRIYTRTGDDGSTGLADGTRVDKDSARVEAMGAVDELNSLIGLLLAHCTSGSVTDCLIRVQHDLFDLGAELAVPGRSIITDAQVQRLEECLDRLNAELPPLLEFILPGGGLAAATCHLARSVCRRAERRLVTLARAGQLNPAARRYLNRLSDLLFVVARVLTQGAETYWQPTPSE